MVDNTPEDFKVAHGFHVIVAESVPANSMLSVLMDANGRAYARLASPPGVTIAATRTVPRGDDK